MRPLVLIVEDNRAERDALKALVRGEGFRVSEARDLKSARGRLESDEPSLVICDHVLPDGLGGEFLHEIGRESCETLLVSSSLEAAADEDQEFLPKPIEVKQLLRILDRLRD